MSITDLQQRDIDTLLHQYTNHHAHQSVGPHVITSGDGIYVTDDQGNRYIEGLAGLFCAPGFQRTAWRKPRSSKISRSLVNALYATHIVARLSTAIGLSNEFAGDRRRICRIKPHGRY